MLWPMFPFSCPKTGACRGTFTQFCNFTKFCKLSDRFCDTFDTNTYGSFFARKILHHCQLSNVPRAFCTDFRLILRTCNFACATFVFFSLLHVHFILNHITVPCLKKNIRVNWWITFRRLQSMDIRLRSCSKIGKSLNFNKICRNGGKAMFLLSADQHARFFLAKYSSARFSCMSEYLAFR